MVGKGKNKKSMAYVGNVVAFLEACILSKQRYGLYNYVDTPDLEMNDLVRLVRSKLKGRDDVGLRIPYGVGILLGYALDIISFVCRKRFPVSSIRIRKFASSTEFRSAKHTLDNFVEPFPLGEGIERTLQSEFVNPNPKREIFYTE